MRPQPIACFAVPTVFHRGREPGCGYQACCEPQMCCLHSIPPQLDLASLDKSQMETTIYNSSCTQPGLISASLRQSQQLQRCWNTESSLQCSPPTSPVPIVGPIQLNCSRGSGAQPQAADSLPHSQSIPYLSCHQHQREALPDSQIQVNADRSRPGLAKAKCSTSTAQQQDLSQTALTRDVMTEESWEERCRVEETCGQTAAVESRELLDEELQASRREQSPVQQLQQLQATLAGKQQRIRPALTLRHHRDGKVRIKNRPYNQKLNRYTSATII